MPPELLKGIREHYAHVYAEVKQNKLETLHRPTEDIFFHIFLLDLWSTAKESTKCWHDLLLWTPKSLLKDVFVKILPWHNAYLTHAIMTKLDLTLYDVECSSKDHCETCMQMRQTLAKFSSAYSV